MCLRIWFPQFNKYTHSAPFLSIQSHPDLFSAIHTRCSCVMKLIRKSTKMYISSLTLVPLDVIMINRNFCIPFGKVSPLVLVCYYDVVILNVIYL